MSYYELPFWRQFLLTCEDNLMGELILLIYLLPFFKEGSIRQHLKKFPLLLLVAPTVAAVNWSTVSVITNAPLMSLLSALSVLAFTLWTMWVWHCSFWQSLSIVCIAGMLQSSFSVILLYLVKAALPLAELESFHPEIVLLMISLTLPVHAAISILSGRLWQKEQFRAFLDDSGNARRTALLLAALTLAFVILDHMQYGLEPRYLTEYLLVTAVMTVLVIVLVFHLTQRDLDQRKLQIQQDMIAQQQLYEQSLEELRQEMLTFRHDYRNLLADFAGHTDYSGLYHSLQDLENGFEKRLGEKIRISAHIGNLRIPQIRSLLLGKLTHMAEQDIECRMEVLYPVEQVYMDIWDLVRCMGILLDNAIEASLATEAPWIDLMLLQEEHTFTLRISNPLAGTVDPARIWEEGWSTKGDNRGLGLFSYRKILQKYPDASWSTSWKDGVFVQELITGGQL